MRSESLLRRFLAQICVRSAAGVRRKTYVVSTVLKHHTPGGHIAVLGARKEFVEKLIQVTDRSCRYTVLDMTDPGIASPKCNFEVCNANDKLPLHDNACDVIVTDQLIEHLYDVDSFFSELKRIAKPGAFVLVGSESLASWQNIAALVMGFHPPALTYSNRTVVGNPTAKGYLGPNPLYPDGHSKVPTVRATTDLLHHYGYRIAGIRCFGNPLPFGKLFDRSHSLYFVLHGHFEE